MPDFPPDFLWGASTAGHQVEGGNTNSNWWAFEHSAGSPTEEPSGDGIDHWNRYDQDFALLAALGQNAHRLSLEWSRIEPADGEFSQAAIDHYQRVLESLHRHGLTPFVTLCHFTIPQWLAERGGWLAPEALDLFGRYVERVAASLGDLVSYFGTINEPQVVAGMGYLNGSHAPGLQDLDKGKQVNHTLAAAHRRAVAAVRTGRGRPQVGACLQIPYIVPLDPEDETDRAVTAKVRSFMIDPHLDDLRSAEDPGDFVGLQYYSRDLIDGSLPGMKAPPPEGAEVTQMGWEVYPAGFGHVLREVAQVGLPILVTENGLATLDDTQRVRFLASHLRELKAARDEGVDVRGYFHWSAFDNYEWGSYEPRFGLIGIDRTDRFRRIVRPSAVVYGEVARTGSLASLDEAACPGGAQP
jgi:beta-glucosidase